MWRSCRKPTNGDAPGNSQGGYKYPRLRWPTWFWRKWGHPGRGYSCNLHDKYDESACSFSFTPNHLAVQSAYIKMIGKFYVRTIMGLDQWMRNYPQTSDNDIQVYVHLIERWHRLFLGELPNNNRFKSFCLLMPRKETCRCFMKLIFCGYIMENVTEPKQNSSRWFTQMSPDLQG